MSLKNDLEMVKEELNSEEKFFEKAVVTEKFVKKYKNVMIGGVVALVIGVGANIMYDISEQNRITKANSVLVALQKDSTNNTLSKELHSLSPALFNVWSYSVAIAQKDATKLKELATSKTLIVNDLAKYEAANQAQDSASLQSYASIQNAIYVDLAIVQDAVILMNEKKIKEAHEKLSMIQESSSLFRVASSLLHYGIK